MMSIKSNLTITFCHLQSAISHQSKHHNTHLMGGRDLKHRVCGLWLNRCHFWLPPWFCATAPLFAFYVNDKVWSTNNSLIWLTFSWLWIPFVKILLNSELILLRNAFFNVLQRGLTIIKQPGWIEVAKIMTKHNEHIVCKCHHLSTWCLTESPYWWSWMHPF